MSVLAIALGLAASLGAGLALVGTGLTAAYGIQQGPGVWFILTAIITATFTIASVLGIDKGIKWLANLTTKIFYALLLLLIVIGPTVYILNLTNVGMGYWLDRFWTWALDPYLAEGKALVTWWTMYDWAIWIAYAPLMGIFFAIIAYGRTIKQFLLINWILPAVFGLVWFSVWGGTALQWQMEGRVDIVQAIKAGDQVIACVAPAFVNQFKDATPAKLRKAMRILGFSDTVEVAIGADLCTIEEAEDFLDKVPEKQPFMATSCCPAWSVMAKKLFPEFAEYISMALTPMVITARLVKKDNPKARIVFVGPCAAKKLEASRRSVRSDVDFVLTFEELQGMFEAKDIDFATLEPDECDKDFEAGTGAGRGFAVVGGVAAAVADYIKEIRPGTEVKMEFGDGLRECRKMLLMAKAGKRDGYLLEGMACPGGCVAGAGTIAPVPVTSAAVKKYKADAQKQSAGESEFADRLKETTE